MNDGSNYPPGVTGNEPQIAGESGWEELQDTISRDATTEGWTDMDAFVAWKLGVAALKAVRSLGGKFGSDSDDAEAHLADCDVNDRNPEGIVKPCNCRKYQRRP